MNIWILKKSETCFDACLKSHFLYHSQFHNLHVNTTKIHKVHKAHSVSMSLSSSWSKSKSCNVRYASSTSELVHSKGSVSGSLRISHWNQSKLIVHCYKAVLPWDSESCCLLTRPQEGSTCTLRKIFWWPLWVALLKNQEYTAKWFFSGVLSNFQQLFLREFPQ